jgi:hypothetical protein
MSVRSDFNKGLEAAVAHLNSTAADYEQSVERIRRQQHRTDREQRDCNRDEEKARLLRGQAGHILALKQK